MTFAFPFSAIVGQDEMKLAILITAVGPTIGGVLVFGDRGTGKSTAAREVRHAFEKSSGASSCGGLPLGATEDPGRWRA